MTIIEDDNLIDLDLLPELDKNLFLKVNEFYQLPPYSYKRSPSETTSTTNEHLKIGNEIGSLMDLQFHDFVDVNNLPSENLITILPLRGGLGLEPEISLIKSQQFLPIEIKRNGPIAEIFFPNDETIQTIAQSGDIIRIKDFGIATGGTTVELAKRCISLGVEPKKIIIQGAVGTKYAKQAILELSDEIVVLYAVEGKMQIEEVFESSDQYDEQNYLSGIKVFSENRTEANKPDDISLNDWQNYIHQDYYLNAISPASEIPQFKSVTPKDWGDSMYSTMNDILFINQFMQRLGNLLEVNGQIEQFSLNSLYSHDKKKFIKT
jgi:hypothetical protein